jgi:hypothetical protein
MSSDSTRLYLKECFMLCKTLKIKSEDSIKKINDDLILRYGQNSVDIYRKETWKYYLNSCGQYHATDLVMTVSSLDTLEEIRFTREVLNLHPTTFLNYQYGTTYYNGLLTKYPEQEQLILGILYPAIMNEAIAAKDGAILAYDIRYIEPQETTLLNELEGWIQAFLKRWHVRAFGLSDTLYPTSQHAIMYLQLIPTLLNLRLKRCKTSEAHTFHISSYLASHGYLDKYIDYLTLKQKLFLYKNIAYIERHPGNADTFNWLIQKLLTDRYIPIADYSIKFIDEFTDTGEPSYHFLKNPINTEYNTTDKDIYTLNEIFIKEQNLVKGNKDYSDANGLLINATIQESPSSVIKTKLLESSIADYGNSEPMSIDSILLNHWGFYASKELYTAPVYFLNPKTNETHVLFADAAFNYLLYFLLCSRGVVPLRIPDFFANRVRRIAKPTAQTMMQVVDRNSIRNTLLANWLLSQQPNSSLMQSTSSFFTFCNAIHEAGLKEWYLISNVHDYIERGFSDNMINTLYADGKATLEDAGTLYSDWFVAHNIIPVEYTREEATLAYQRLFIAATGYELDETKTLASIQKAGIDILTQLSSYSIQFVKSINKTPYISINWPAIRAGKLTAMQYGYAFIPSVIDVLFSLFSSRRLLEIEITPFVSTISVSGSQSCQINISTDAYVVEHIVPELYVNIVFQAPVISFEYNGLDLDIFSKYGGIGFEGYEALTEAQKLSIVDIYH